MCINAQLNSTGKRIRMLRRDKSLKQAELAELIGMRQSYISKLEKDAGNPSGPTVLKLAGALGTTADFLLTLSDDPRRVNIPTVTAAPEMEAAYG